MVQVTVAPHPELERLLAAHPHVSRLQVGGKVPCEILVGQWTRRIWIGRADIEVRGLVELMDNNPIVCADEISLPSPVATLALIALGPLARAGLLADSPTMLSNFTAPQAELNDALALLGWEAGMVFAREEQDLAGAVAATTIAAVHTPDNLEDIDALYEESYGRSFFVHAHEEATWDVAHVLGTPHALYRLRITPDTGQSLLTVQVMADRHGKCGAAQIVHAMNVMLGYEESLGIS
jgi:N-acetyl-gamma-glutamylphosphate reductase